MKQCVRLKIRSVLLLLLSFVLIEPVSAAKVAVDSMPDVKLYTLNCGAINVHNGSDFSDTEFYSSKPLHLADPCFLIKHPKGWLLWDLGLGDQYVGHPVENTRYGVTLTVSVSLISQLKQLGLTPKDIRYIALSHTHFDHTGNARLFPHATWLMQRKEYEAIQEKLLPPATDSQIVPFLRSVHKILLNGDYDVFSDNSVVILRTYGHTAGHQSLQIRLKNSGIIILSGDLYHTRRAYHYKQVPAFNESRADTLASMSRVDGILQNTEARFIIQHDEQDFAALPTFPKYLD
jgi:N-acyl homoserine lactone hydrolase